SEDLAVDLVAGREYNSNSQLSGIEGVLGGGGDDWIQGDAEGNWLDGGAGDDTLLGGAGNDTLLAGAGSDSLDGGAGWNAASYATFDGRVEVNLEAGQARGYDAEGEEIKSDLLANIQAVVGGAGDDTLTAAAAGSWLDGAGGNNHLIGGIGNDTLASSGLGQDTLDGGAGFDTADYRNASEDLAVDLVAGREYNSNSQLSGIEGVLGGGGDDWIQGDAEGNWLDGGAGDDTLLGGAGNDTLLAGAGSDSLDGGAGWNAASYATFDGRVEVNLEAGQARGYDAEGEEIKSDLLANIQAVVGGAGDDWIQGDANANWLYGGEGDDTLDGAGGGDTLFGGDGADHFIYSAGDGFTVIGDYVAGTDKFELHGLTTYTTYLAGTGTDTVVDFGNGDRLYLVGIRPEDLSQHITDFHFI
ncbi:MAG: calcium-binding protein, partial [Acetobacteraceae bacterium]|nr:calcium-binding protein [Acetobacteraceae bacterium]